MAVETCREFDLNESLINRSLATLTPIWTGGLDSTHDRLHETSLTGSLRWWYEALMRGLGSSACDPTEHVCIYDQKKPNGGLCEACRLFGATGWARKFRLVASERTKPLLNKDIIVKIPSGRRGGWYLYGSSQMGEIKFDLRPLRQIEKAEETGLKIVLALIARHASIAGKTSNGYGVLTSYEIQDKIIGSLSVRPTSRGNYLPDLRDFFFAKFVFDEPRGNPDWWKRIRGIEEAILERRDAEQKIGLSFRQKVIPLAPAIRNWLRYYWGHGLDSCEDYFIFGKSGPVCPVCCLPVKQDKKYKGNYWCFDCRSSFRKGDEKPSMSSKINVSYAYRREDGKWEFRIWGWVPCSGAVNNRDAFLDAMKNELMSADIWNYVFSSSSITPTMLEWHSQKCQQEDLITYLKELLASNCGGAQ